MQPSFFDMPVVVKLPSQHLADLLNGHVAYADTPPAIQSWATLSIHEGALSLLRIADKESRNAALLKVPETLRPLVRAEVVRLWGLR
jgi:hypothetical protein